VGPNRSTRHREREEPAEFECHKGATAASDKGKKRRNQHRFGDQETDISSGGREAEGAEGRRVQKEKIIWAKEENKLMAASGGGGEKGPFGQTAGGAV